LRNGNGEKHTRATHGEDDASDFNNALTIRLANLNNDLWIVDIVELASSAGDDGPGFTEDASSSWNL